MPPKKEAPVITLSTEQLESLADKVMDKLDARLANREAQVDSRLDKLDLKVDDIEQRSRLENLRIFGIPEKPGEQTDQLVIDVASKIGVTLTSSSIGRSHRVGPKKPGSKRAIIVKFVSFADRQKMFTAKKQLKGTNITIKEDLTAARQAVLKKAMEKFSDCPVWTRNGVIIIKSKDNDFHRV